MQEAFPQWEGSARKRMKPLRSFWGMSTFEEKYSMKEVNEVSIYPGKSKREAGQ
jgi:hypothetical protein